MIHKGIIEELLSRHGSQPFDDWALSDLARRRNLAIKVATPSMIEHIGLFGFNNATPDHFDHSFDFPTAYIDQPTRDFFARTHGVDLLRCLGTVPDQDSDLSRIALCPAMLRPS
ncbi:MAG TPA: hypothetical protein VL742_12335 [Casimicrobiaceae bacterium]|nr:hypothetical protein [Casimicrobiaceae bacterium]